MQFFKLILFISFFQFSIGGFSQSDQLYFKGGTQIPFQHFVASEYVVKDRIGFQIQGGIIATPYEGYIKSLITFFGDDEVVTSIINDSYKSGFVLGSGFNYHFNRYYFGLYAQLISLKASSAASSAIGKYYGIDLSFVEALVGPVVVNIQSNLYNGGTLFGRRFLFRDSRFQIHVDVAVSKNFGSRNRIYSNLPNIDRIPFVQETYNTVDERIQQTYLESAYIPSLNIAFVYNLMGK